MSQTLRIPILVALCVVLPAGTAFTESPASLEHPDALIGTSEKLSDHEGQYEDISDHEGAYEDIHNLEGSTEDIHAHEGRTENLRDHHADSEQIAPRTAESERIHGRGHVVHSTEDKLATAREKLRAARARHAKRAAYDKANQAPQSEIEWDQWRTKLDIAHHRIEVAQQFAELMDKNHAEMIRTDYPRGERRQKLIDTRAGSKTRLAAEQSAFRKMVSRARASGAPQGVFASYE